MAGLAPNASSILQKTQVLFGFAQNMLFDCASFGRLAQDDIYSTDRHVSPSSALA
jgi:hypothetical protein